MSSQSSTSSYANLYPNNMPLNQWLLQTFQTTTLQLINELEISMIQDCHYVHNERLSKHKFLPITVSQTHLEYHVNNLLHNLKTTIINAVHNERPTLTLNMSLIKQKPHLFDHTLTLRKSKKPWSIMQIASHKTIYEHLKSLQHKLIFLDIETDGINIQQSNILSICLTSINLKSNPLLSDKHKEWMNYIKPHLNYNVNTDDEAFKVNKITQKTLDQSGISLLTISDKLIQLLTTNICVGFNINKFDIPIIRNNLKKHNKLLPKIQTIDLYQAHHQLKPHNLSTALKDLNCYPIPSQLLHSATGDTDACIRLLAALTLELKLPTTPDGYSNLNLYNQRIFQIC